jgi:hypothetical protein
MFCLKCQGGCDILALLWEQGCHAAGLQARLWCWKQSCFPPIAGWHAFCSFVEEVCVSGSAWAFQNVSGVVRERRGDLGETENRRTI